MTSEKKEYNVLSHAFGAFQLWRNGALVEERAEPPKQFLHHGEEVQEVDEPGWVYASHEPLLICKPHLFVDIHFNMDDYGSYTLPIKPDGTLEEVQQLGGCGDGGNMPLEGPQKPKSKKSRAPKSERLTTDQLAELIAIDKRDGLRGQLQRFIHALNSGGQALEAPAEDIVIDYHCEWWEVERQRQALVLWQKGIGLALGFSSFRKYLASIPEVPAQLRVSNGKFNRLVLVEGRMCLRILCQTVGIFNNKYDRLDPEDNVRWMRCQDGRRYRNKSAKVVTQQIFTNDEVGLNIFEGIGLYLQFPRVLCEEYIMVCTEGPQISSEISDSNTLSLCRQGPEVSWTFGTSHYPRQGAASKLRL